MVIMEEDHVRFVELLDGLREEANAKFAFLLDRSGQQISSAGAIDGLDPTSLASLAAGNVAATEGLAQLIGESRFSTLFHEGESDSIHISLVADKLILLVIFDQRSSLGLVRLRVKQRTAELSAHATAMLDRAHSASDAPALSSSALSEITDEDIDALFG